MMNKEAFAKEILKWVTVSLGTGYDVDVQKVLKDNNLLLTGLMIHKRNNALGITIYLDEYFKDYKKGRTLTNIVEDILSIYKQRVMSENINLNFLENKEELLKRAAFRIINRDVNKEILSNCPYVEIAGDLVKIFFIYVDCENDGIGSMTVSHYLMKMYDLSLEELNYHADNNTPIFFPYNLFTMGQVLAKLFGEYYGKSDFGMWTLTNNSNIYGAAAMLYNGVLKKISSDLKSNLYIIPSSQHEIIIMRATEDFCETEMKTIIEFINCTQVYQEDFLSNNLYLYTQATNQISVV